MRGVCLYLEVASQLSSVRAELRRSPAERRAKTTTTTLLAPNNTALSFSSNIVHTDGFLYLVGGFQEWYVTLRAQLILNFIPVPVLILKQYPGEK